MNKNIFCILFFLVIYTGKAQTNDSISPIIQSKKISYKQFIVPTAMLTAGALMVNTALNVRIQKNANTFFGSDFSSQADNVLLVVPAAQIYLGKSFGFQSKNDFHHQSLQLAVANAIAISTTMALKYTIKEERPDKSDNLSFPSGHTTIAFTNAALLYYEYKDSNVWYASSGFLFATATGIFRIANNKHYTSDVLAGAGIGLASGLIVSYWNPCKSLTFGKKNKSTALIYPQMGSQIGMGAIVSLN
jgi:hypothetical protein